MAACGSGEEGIKDAVIIQLLADDRHSCGVKMGRVRTIRPAPVASADQRDASARWYSGAPLVAIAYEVRQSCAGHPLVDATRALPAQGSVRISRKRLWLLGTLMLQDPDPRVSLASYEETSKKWQTFAGQYNVYLRETAHGFETIANSERLTSLSEVVGVACAVALLGREFRLNPNRIQRFIGTKKRMDFEFYRNGARYFHEAKGTTYAKKEATFLADILTQKNATKGTLAGVLGATGTLAIYDHELRQGGTRIVMVDPPLGVGGEGNGGGDDEDGGRPGGGGPNGELLAVVGYYARLLAVTHMGNWNEWMTGVLEDIQAGRNPPENPPLGLDLRGRVQDPTAARGAAQFEGTMFDNRLTPVAVERYASFEEASRSIDRPIYFVGVRQAVVQMIRECRWADLAAYEEPDTWEDDDGEADATLLPSGAIVRELDAAPDEEAEAANIFRRLRRQHLARLRALRR